MEEKRYPTIEEVDDGEYQSSGIDMACEPVAVSIATEPQSADGVTEVHDWIDDLDWDRFPSLGPFSEEDAIARIDKIEEDLKAGKVKWTSEEEFEKELYEEFPWLK